jgi:hypothetical protein
MLLDRSNPTSYWSEIIAAADPEPVRAPRYVVWPSVCDTTRTNWLNPAAEPSPAAPLPGAESFSIDIGCHLHAPPLPLGESLPEHLQNVETICAPVATPAQQAVFTAHTFTYHAAPPPLSTDLGKTLYSTILCGPDLPPPPAPKRRKRPEAEKPRKRRGRPLIFDEIKRAEFLAMVKSGSTIRHAARRVGVDPGSVRNACKSDPLFADRVARAEQERDTFFIRRIQNAGEKSWRAAAWILERAEPKEFSLRQKGTALSSLRGQRRLQAMITAALQKLLPGDAAATNKPSNADPRQNSIHDRLTAVESKLREYDSWGAGDLENDDPVDQLDEPGGASSPISNNGERGGVSPPISHSDVIDQSDQAAADEAYQELRRLLGTDSAEFFRQNMPMGKK